MIKEGASGTQKPGQERKETWGVVQSVGMGTGRGILNGWEVLEGTHTVGAGGLEQEPGRWGWGLMGRNRGPRGRVSGHNHGGAPAGENKVLGERKSGNRRTECEGLHAWMTTNNGWGSGGWRGGA